MNRLINGKSGTELIIDNYCRHNTLNLSLATLAAISVSEFKLIDGFCSTKFSPFKP